MLAHNEHKSATLKSRIHHFFFHLTHTYRAPDSYSGALRILDRIMLITPVLLLLFDGTSWERPASLLSYFSVPLSVPTDI